MRAAPRITGFTGSVVTEGLEYERAIGVWNRAPRHRPAAVACCVDEADVARAVSWATANGVPLSARAGGHSYQAQSVVSDGIVIDLRALRDVRLSQDRSTVALEPGLRWTDVDDVLGPEGLAVPGGSVSKVGVAGFTIGTGLGWMGRTAGTASDSLLAARVVTADGDVLDADDHRHPDLFWALRGGCGNFGIVTRLVLRTRPIRDVLAGPLVYSIDDAPAVLREFAGRADELPAEVNWAGVMTTPPPEAGLPPDVAGRPVLLIPLLYLGEPSAGKQALAELRSIGSPRYDFIAPTSWGDFQRSTDEAAPDGRCWDVRSEWMTRLDGERIDAAVDAAKRAPTSYCEVLFRPLGGDLNSADMPDTPFSWRSAAYLLEVIASWSVGQDSRRLQEWMVDTWTGQLPLSAGGGDVSHLGLGEGTERIRSAYSPAAYARLVDVKRRYDPRNVFRSVQNIPPSS